MLGRRGRFVSAGGRFGHNTQKPDAKCNPIVSISLRACLHYFRSSFLLIITDPERLIVEVDHGLKPRSACFHTNGYLGFETQWHSLFH
jgi:hypothetical protein